MHSKLEVEQPPGRFCQPRSFWTYGNKTSVSLSFPFLTLILAFQSILYSLFLSMKVKVLVALWCPVVCDSHGLWPARLLCPWNSPGKNTGESSHSLFQGIFQTQGLNLVLPQCKWIPYNLSHQGSASFLNFLEKNGWWIWIPWGKGRRVFVEYSEVFVFLTKRFSPKVLSLKIYSAYKTLKNI